MASLALPCSVNISTKPSDTFFHWRGTHDFCKYYFWHLGHSHLYPANYYTNFLYFLVMYLRSIISHCSTCREWTKIQFLAWISRDLPLFLEICESLNLVLLYVWYQFCYWMNFCYTKGMYDFPFQLNLWLVTFLIKFN